MTLEIDKNTIEVYYMNRDGKTIDTYRWAPSKANYFGVPDPPISAYNDPRVG